MDILLLLKDDLALIVTVLIYAVLIAAGYRKGLVKMLTSFMTVAASVVISLYLSPVIGRMMEQNPSWTGWADASVLPFLPGVGRHFVFTAISFAASFVIVLIILKILAAALDFIAKLPILNFINRVLGVLLGMGEATVYIWVLMIIIHVMPNIGICREAAESISRDPFLYALNENNLISAFIRGFLHAG